MLNKCEVNLNDEGVGNCSVCVCVYVCVWFKNEWRENELPGNCSPVCVVSTLDHAAAHLVRTCGLVTIEIDW